MFNLARSLDRNTDRAPHEDAVIFRDTRLTHRQLLDRVNALAAAFGGAGVGQGDIVALLMGNRPEFLETLPRNPSGKVLKRELRELNRNAEG